MAKKALKIDATFDLTTQWDQIIGFLQAPPDIEEDRPPTVQVNEPGGGHCLLMDLVGESRLVVEGDVGHYACAFNNGPDIRVHGNAGDGLGEGMRRGNIRLHGNAGRSAGTAMSGGTLAIYGNVGPEAGCGLQGGNVFIRGNAGPGAAAGALAGTLVIGGNAAEGLGDELQAAVLFVRGETAELGRGLVETPVSQAEKLRLGLLLIDAGIRGEPTDFRRFVSQHSASMESHKKIGKRPQKRAAY